MDTWFAEPLTENTMLKMRQTHSSTSDNDSASEEESQKPKSTPQAIPPKRTTVLAQVDDGADHIEIVRIDVEGKAMFL